MIAFENGRLLKIENVKATLAANLSGISHAQYVSKLATMPLGVTVSSAPSDYREEFSPEDSWASMVYEVPWSIRKEWCDWMVGYSFPTGDGRQPNPAGILSRIVPAQHPQYPWMYARRARLVSAGGIAVESETSFPLDDKITSAPLQTNGQPVLIPMPHFIDNQGTRHVDGIGKYEVMYRPVDFEIRTDQEAAEYATKVFQAGKVAVPMELTRYVERVKTYSIMALPINRLVANGQGQASLVFDDPNSPFAGERVREAGVMLMPQYQMLYTWHEISDPPEEAMTNCIGKVNADWFDGVSGNGPFPPGTMLLEEPRKVRHRNIAGRVTHTMTYRFSIRFPGWNYFPTANGLLLHASLSGELKGTVKGQEIFQGAPFNTLFSVPVPVKYQ